MLMVFVMIVIVVCLFIVLFGFRFVVLLFGLREVLLLFELIVVMLFIVELNCLRWLLGWFYVAYTY